MGLNDLISKVTDPYERQARLYPALLALLPLIVVLALLYGAKVSVLTDVVMITGSCGGVYLLTNICREWGKRLEPKLFEAWGGKPTTQLLRHRDINIEGVTKRRYHALLSSKIKEPFPDSQQEALNPSAADELYQSAVRWLLNKTRDKEIFKLLFLENIAYGFRRNALGIKPIGIAVSIGSALLVLVNQGVIETSYLNKFIINPRIELTVAAMLSLMTSIMMLLMWFTFFTIKSTRCAAFTYAESLLRTCDVLDNK